MVVFLIKVLLVVRSRVYSQRDCRLKFGFAQQVLILDRKSPSRVRLRNLDRVILVWLCRLFPLLLNAITLVKPETVIRWQRRGFRTYWHWKFRRRSGRPKIDRG